MSVSPLPGAAWEARKVQLSSGLCHHCVMGEPLPNSDLTGVMSKVLETQHAWTWVLRWLKVDNGRSKGCVPEVLDAWNQLRRLLPFPGWVLTFAEVCLLKQASFVASWTLTFSPPFLAVADYSFKRAERTCDRKSQEEPIRGPLVRKKPEREIYLW